MSLGFDTGKDLVWIRLDCGERGACEEIFLYIFYPGWGAEFMADEVVEVAEKLLWNMRHVGGA